jgi:hypothetical protein
MNPRAQSGVTVPQEQKPKTQVENRTWGTRQEEPKTQVENQTWGTRQAKRGSKPKREANPRQQQTHDNGKPKRKAAGLADSPCATWGALRYMGRKLGSGEELVVAGGGEGEIAQAFCVDGDYVGVPEGDVGEIVGG